MMTKQTRHYAARTQKAGPTAGLPGPGQALIGFPEPQSSLFGDPLQTISLFGVPQQVARELDRTPIELPPRPRTPYEGYSHTRRPQRRTWPQVLGFPLGVLVLGVALGVIAVVMLVAAGVPAPWE
jgi:hypothetical protein